MIYMFLKCKVKHLFLIILKWTEWNTPKKMWSIITSLRILSIILRNFTNFTYYVCFLKNYVWFRQFCINYKYLKYKLYMCMKRCTHDSLMPKFYTHSAPFRSVLDKMINESFLKMNVFTNKFSGIQILFVTTTWVLKNRC